MSERNPLHDRESGDVVILEQLGRGAAVGLILPYGADPGVESYERPLERLDLADPAAAVGVGPVQWSGIGQRLQLDEIEAVLPDEPLLESGCLREMEPGGQEHHGHRP